MHENAVWPEDGVTTQGSSIINNPNTCECNCKIKFLVTCMTASDTKQLSWYGKCTKLAYTGMNWNSFEGVVMELEG